MTDEVENFYTTFECYVTQYQPEPGGTLTVRASLESETTILLPAGVVRNFEEIGDMPKDKTVPVRVGILTAFVERHGTLSEMSASDNEK